VGIEDDLIRAIFREPGDRGDVVPVHDATRRAIRELQSTRAALDRLEAALVQRARFAGASWAEIAADLGVGREAARRRHTRDVRIAKPRSSL
jgi:hypothetical protein